MSQKKSGRIRNVDELEVTDALRNWMVTNQIHVDPVDQLERAKEHWGAKGIEWKDYLLAFRKWLRKAEEIRQAFGKPRFDPSPRAAVEVVADVTSVVDTPHGAIQAEIGAVMFKNWINPLEIEVDGQVANVTAPSRMIADRVNRDYRPVIAIAFGCKYVRVHVGPKSSAAAET